MEAWLSRRYNTHDPKMYKQAPTTDPYGKHPPEDSCVCGIRHMEEGLPENKRECSSAAANSLQLCPTLWPHRRQPTRLPHHWDSPGKNTGVGCHFLLQCMKVKSQSEVTQLCLTLSDPMDCSLPGSSVHGIFQARVLEWGAIAFSKCSSTLPLIQAESTLESDLKIFCLYQLLVKSPKESFFLSIFCLKSFY